MVQCMFTLFHLQYNVRNDLITILVLLTIYRCLDCTIVMVSTKSKIEGSTNWAIMPSFNKQFEHLFNRDILRYINRSLSPNDDG